MHPTLYHGSFGFSIRAFRHLQMFKRFDIVVIDSPMQPEVKWVKRIIALAGETVEYRDNKLYINGKYQEESFLDSSVITDDFPPYIVPEGHFFVVGDNRQNSADSRLFGAINYQNLYSVHAFILFPLEKLGFPR